MARKLVKPNENNCRRVFDSVEQVVRIAQPVPVRDYRPDDEPHNRSIDRMMRDNRAAGL